MPGPSEWLIILLVVLVLFGGSQLPKLARSLGQAQREFKTGLSDGAKSDDTASGSNTSSGPNTPSGSGADDADGSGADKH